MHRIFDFTPTDSEVVVSRVLVHLHQAIDETFPHAAPASQRFATTDFVGYDEPTLNQVLPNDLVREHSAMSFSESREDGSPQNRSLKFKQQTTIESQTEMAKPQAADEEDANSWHSQRNLPIKQSLIGILTLILGALLAYFLYQN